MSPLLWRSGDALHDAPFLTSIHECYSASSHGPLVCRPHKGGDIIIRRTAEDGTLEKIRHNYRNEFSRDKEFQIPKILKMDGRFEHQLGAFTGVRYSVVYYKSDDRRMTKPDPPLWPPEWVT